MKDPLDLAGTGLAEQWVTELVVKRVDKSKGRISAKRLLPVAQAAGYQGSARNFRRLVADQKALWRRSNHRGRRPASRCSHGSRTRSGPAARPR